jgi:8-oxo-dGTP diphosphatase
MTCVMQNVIVGCLVRNAADELLLIRHHKRGWEIPQGHVAEGESLIAALHREVREESGVAIVLGPLAVIWSKLTVPPALIFTFLGRYQSGDLAASTDSEEACWFTVPEALDKVTNPVMRERLDALLNYNGSVSYRSYTTRPFQSRIEKDLGGWL